MERKKRKYAKTNAFLRKKRKEDPEYRKKRNEQAKACNEKRTETDPNWRKHKYPQERAQQRLVRCTDEYRQKNNEYMRQRYKNDTSFRLKVLLRNRLHSALDGTQKASTTIELCGCDLEELICHISSMFQEGMTWDNMGEWHVDHIVPMAAFNLSCKEQQQIVMWYKNLQPLWKKDNLVKSATYDEEDKQSLILKFRANHCHSKRVMV